MSLKTDFINDVLDPSMNGKRRYRLIENPDGTVSFEDVTTYSEIGSVYGAGEINEQNEAINELNNNLEELKTYSDTERIVGTFNGKDVYEKTVIKSGALTQATVLDSTLTNSYIDNVLNIDGTLIRQDGSHDTLGYIAELYFASDGMRINRNTNFSSISWTKCCFVIRYTKK